MFEKSVEDAVTVPVAEMGLNDKFWFGTYRGYTVRQVCKWSLSYVEECILVGLIKLNQDTKLIYYKIKSQFHTPYLPTGR